MSFCQGCAECCYDVAPALDADKLKEIAEFTDMKPEDFAEIIYEKKDDTFNIEVYQLKHKGDERRTCVFLDDNRTCSIYPVRPTSCRDHYCPEIETMDLFLESGALMIEDIYAIDVKYDKKEALNVILKIERRSSKINLSREDKTIVRRNKLNESIWEFRRAVNAKHLHPRRYDSGRPGKIKRINNKYRQELLKGLI